MEKNWRKVFLFVWATENQSLQAALSQVWPEWKAGHSIGSFYLKDKAGVLGTIRFFSSSLISVLYYSKGLVTEMFFCYKTLIHWVFKLNNSLKYMFLQGTGNQITCIFWVLTKSMHGCRQIPEIYRFILHESSMMQVCVGTSTTTLQKRKMRKPEAHRINNLLLVTPLVEDPGFEPRISGFRSPAISFYCTAYQKKDII